MTLKNLIIVIGGLTLFACLDGADRSGNGPVGGSGGGGTMGGGSKGGSSVDGGFVGGGSVDGGFAGGSSSCRAIASCWSSCAEGDGQCGDQCVAAGSPQGKAQWDQVVGCIRERCEGQGETQCYGDSCEAQFKACFELSMMGPGASELTTVMRGRAVSWITIDRSSTMQTEITTTLSFCSDGTGNTHVAERTIFYGAPGVLYQNSDDRFQWHSLQGPQGALFLQLNNESGSGTLFLVQVADGNLQLSGQGTRQVTNDFCQ